MEEDLTIKSIDVEMEEDITIKRVFKSLAKYNSITNKEVISILEDLDPAKLVEKVKSYYGSIMGLLNHQAQSDIGWIHAWCENIKSLKFGISELESFLKNRPSSFEELQWISLEDFKIARIKIDALLERVIDAIPDEQYAKILKIENKRGKVEFETWRFIMHLFNHQTHHRGSLAAVLDHMGVHNDYSNFLWKV